MKSKEILLNDLYKRLPTYCHPDLRDYGKAMYDAGYEAAKKTISDIIRTTESSKK